MPSGLRGVPSTEAIATITTGEAIDIASTIPSGGLTVICFTAEF
ncbi:MAG: hypothetical protein ACI89X_001356 [Planctomycetota bacterium]|jgi:hypothetical protein